MRPERLHEADASRLRRGARLQGPAAAERDAHLLAACERRSGSADARPNPHRKRSKLAPQPCRCTMTRRTQITGSPETSAAPPHVKTWPVPSHEQASHHRVPFRVWAAPAPLFQRQSHLPTQYFPGFGLTKARVLFEVGRTASKAGCRESTDFK